MPYSKEQRQAYYQRNKERLKAERVESKPVEGKRNKTEKELRIDLGIAICHALTQPGKIRTLEEIAAYADCSKQAISAIEHKALNKLYKAICRDKDLLAYVQDLGMLKSNTKDLSDYFV